jgi:putative hydrolase of the HAD superfamily
MLILFDIDDTLVDHSAAFRKALTALHRHSGSALSLDGFVDACTAAQRRHFARYVAGMLSYEQQRRARIREACSGTLSDHEADELFAVYLHEYEACWRLFDDVLPCLDRLANHQLGVISNGQSEQQRKKLACLGISDRFDYVLISEECDWAKPDVEIFAHALSSLSKDADAAFYIGDRYELDAAPARKAGLCGVWLDRHKSASDSSHRPVIESLYELPHLVWGQVGPNQG